MEDLQGKVAVITGGASGIGRAVADRAAAEGMKIVLADIEEGPLKEAEDDLTSHGAEALGVVTDVADAASVRALRDRALDRFGAVHLVHNNAGIGLGGPIWEVSEQDWRWILGVNLWGVIHGVATFVPLLIEQGEGHVVNTASIAGLIDGPVPRPLQRDQAGRRGHLRDALQGPAGGRRAGRASRSCAPASCRRASPSPTATARLGARPRGRRRGRAPRRDAEHGRRRHPAGDGGRPGHRRRPRPTPSTSSPTPSSTPGHHDALRRHRAGAAAQRRPLIA